MRTRKKVLGLIPMMILWAMACVIGWSWVFTFLTDTDAAHKVTLFVDAEVPGETELASALEKNLPEGIRMVKVHPFSYALMDDSELRAADLYILRESQMETYRDWLRPLPKNMPYAETALRMDGAAWGLPAYLCDESCVAVAGSCIRYSMPGKEKEAFYLCFGKHSLHMAGNEGAVDDAAVTVALELLALR